MSLATFIYINDTFLRDIYCNEKCTSIHYYSKCLLIFRSKFYIQISKNIIFLVGPQVCNSHSNFQYNNFNYILYSLCIYYFVYPAIPKRNIHSDSYKL